MKQIHCSIGVLAYNESANIAKLLNALKSQKTEHIVIDEIIVVSSASSDGTDEIVKEFCDDKIKLISEPERKGKSAAINTFIKAVKSEVLVIESGDTIPAEDTVELMVAPFLNPETGMTGGRPLPENDDKSFVGYSVNLLWRLHHKMAMISPKLGEMVAFRRVFESIPDKSAVDEASIEALIKEKGLKLKYVPEAIVHNKGPENIRDFILQRRRIETGHLWLKKNQNYEVISQDSGILLKISLNEIMKDPKNVIRFTGTMLMEIYSRFLGWFDFNIKKKNPFKWDIATSTKNLEHK
jgi:poly-beta-1,6-N-acetyl-D-glucosamine synthase